MNKEKLIEAYILGYIRASIIYKNTILYDCDLDRDSVIKQLTDEAKEEAKIIIEAHFEEYLNDTKESI